MQASTSLKYLATAVAVAALAACGGGGGGDSTPTTPTTPTTPASKFTKTGVKWTFELPASGSLCYDFDAQAQTADCSGTAWDVKVVSSGRTAALYTNSGPSGTGKGAALGTPFTYTWTKLQAYQDATVDPDSKQTVPDQAWIADSASSAFSGTNAIQTAAFEYDLNGTHQLSPNFRVFLITTNSASADITGAAGKVYALQLTGYYGGPTGTASGWPSFRWVDVANPGNVLSTPAAGIDATGGWVYYDLENNAKTTESGNWQIAFNRYNVKLNGGSSGSSTVAGFLSKTPAGFYEADGKTPITAKFNATSNPNDTLADLTGAQTGPASANAWVKDSVGSQLSPAYTGTYPNALNYGWYSYYPTDAAAAAVGLSQHQLKANPDAATLVKSGAGNSYARMHLTEIKYAAATPAYSGKQTWTIEFDVQPAAN